MVYSFWFMVYLDDCTFFAKLLQLLFEEFIQPFTMTINYKPKTINLSYFHFRVLIRCCRSLRRKLLTGRMESSLGVALK